MDRNEFERLRDLPGKEIVSDIQFSVRKQTKFASTIENIAIQNAIGIDARLTIIYNPSVGSKVFNVHIPGVGPICRLCVDGKAHRPAGRSHKHSLQTPQCPENNIPISVQDCPDLSGKTIRNLFELFCKMANIDYTGAMIAPDE